DVIILDTAPLLATNDALDIAPMADAIVLVARAERSMRDAAERAVVALGRIGADPVGVVLVGTQLRSGDYYYESDRRRRARAPLRVVPEQGVDAPAWVEEELARAAPVRWRADDTRRSS